MSLSRLMKFVTGGLEAFLGIPILGGAFIIFTGYTALWVMLALHLVTLLICHKEHAGRFGSVVGIVTSLVGFIPVVGMIMHIVSAIVLILGALTQQDNNYPRPYRRVR
ncbi:hypothetical protein ACFQI7_25490 [Paenibacillus allorhizosphaerae]|uniref:DUF4064 domain-containing protein n=1 Tax=Paenibacillus allorhizosphaerae TaxID=2849866 RepID=A0ABM8VJA9_9BACL|nr:hypothetical protein [Paenibacillus allorhizosphaerae]CAG7645277.1 hypothetical protein PAECIP111802_03476 [Paenibacillus allorhizosphaerae]